MFLSKSLEVYNLVRKILWALLDIPKPLCIIVVVLVGVPDLAQLFLAFISAEFLPADVTVFVELVLSAFLPFAFPLRRAVLLTVVLLMVVIEILVDLG